MVLGLRRAFIEARGREPVVSGKDVPTDASHFIIRLGTPTIIFSPGDGFLVHTANEYRAGVPTSGSGTHRKSFRTWIATSGSGYGAGCVLASALGDGSTGILFGLGLPAVACSASIHHGHAVVNLECPKPKVVGKPYEGEPHVRFDAAGNGILGNPAAPFLDPTTNNLYK